MGRSETGDDGAGRSRGMPIQPPKPGKALSIFILLCGLGIVGVGAYTYVQDTGTLDNRVEVTAAVTETDIKVVPGSRGRERYIPQPTFQYRFEGATYTSNHIFPGDSQPEYEDRADAQAALSAYTVGDSVTAYVDPDAPGAAYLQDSRSGRALGAILFGLVVSLIAGGRLYQVWGRVRGLRRSG